MEKAPNTQIVAEQSREEFFGRDAELDALVALAGESTRNRCIRISHGPGFGATELLKQVYDELFRRRSERVPIYFSVRRSDLTAAACARRLAGQFLLQAAAFKLRDARIVSYAPGPNEICDLVSGDDKQWVDRLAAFLSNDGGASGNSPSAEAAIGALLRASENVPSIVFIDDLDDARFLIDGDVLVDAINAAATHVSATFVVAELRRSHLGLAQCGSVNLRPLSHRAAGQMLEAQAKSLDIEINDQARDLIALQLDCRPARIATFLRAAADRETSLVSLREVQKVYTDEVVGGLTARYFRQVIDDAAWELQSENRIISTLHDVYSAGSEGISRAVWEQRVGPAGAAVRAIGILNANELVCSTSGRVVPNPHDLAFADHLDVRYRLEIGGGNRALVVGDILNDTLKRAPDLLAQLYRRNSSAGLRELLASFDARSVPEILFDHFRFKSEFGGMPDAEIIELLGGCDTTTLPQTVQAVYTESIYKSISHFVDRERSAVGRGFTGRRYGNEEEIVWIAAEIESKMEATPDVAEFWCDRLEMVALFCGFSKYKMWLIAPDGFSEAATETLRSRGAFGSSRKQVDLLRKWLDLQQEQPEHPADEYEIVVPMGDDTELIAAHAVEEMAKQHDLDARSINQIKTALVEACINASEHSHSPDRKIYQRFRFDDNKLTITISNRGLRLRNRRPAEEPDGGRRGWGLALMRNLMDEVHIEDVEDGTSISMTKYLPKSA